MIILNTNLGLSEVLVVLIDFLLTDGRELLGSLGRELHLQHREDRSLQVLRPGIVTLGEVNLEKEGLVQKCYEPIF